MGGGGSRGVYLLGGYTWSQGCTWSGDGVPGLGGWCTWSGGGTWLGVYLVQGGVPGPGGMAAPGPGDVRYSPPVNRMTDVCKNITLPQLRCGR